MFIPLKDDNQSEMDNVGAISNSRVDVADREPPDAFDADGEGDVAQPSSDIHMCDLTTVVYRRYAPHLGIRMLG
jgi:hypothetical protein